MKWKYSILSFLILTVLVVSTAFYQETLESEKEAAQLGAVVQILQRAHFEPITLNDEFSQELFDLYMERLDYGKKFLTDDEYASLTVYKLELDDQINARTTEFFDESYRLLEAGIKRGEQYVNEIMEQPFDYSTAESIDMDYDLLPYASSTDGLRDRWRQSLKYEALGKYRELKSSQEENATEEEMLSDEELEIKSRTEVKELYDDWFERLGKLRRADRFGDYLNAMTNLYDPHSDYFSPKQKEDFDINMGRSLEGIGARLRADGAYVKVANIVPGGPAYKQKDLSEDDAILTVAQEGEEPVNAVGMRIDDVVGMIRGAKGTKVILKVRKVDQSEQEITIVRDKVILDEGKAKSVVLDHAGVMEDIGYIRLPRFYADFDDPEGNSCATDIEKEIEKLNQHGVNGIILDLRNNGGGSLRDVVRMTGFFIEDGPVVQVKSRGRAASVYEDDDEKVQYDGPLVVMVNHNSASASEIIAAALQDYDRAVIVGSNSTFGKGTVQRFIDLDRYVMNNEHKPLGEIKVTMQKFYRVDGGSTQLKGVVPDLILPDNYHYIDSGEKELNKPLPWTEIDDVEYVNTVSTIPNREELQRKSSERIDGSETFSKVLENAERLKTLRDMKSFPLDYSGYDAMMTQREQDAEAAKDIYQPIAALDIENLEQDLAFIQADSSRIDRNDSWIKNLQKDHYLEETIFILRDMVTGMTTSTDGPIKKD